MALEADPIDRKHLDQLGARFGAPFVAQLIDVFIAEGRERVAVAAQAAAAGDTKGVAAAAHALKSSAGNLGARALGARAATLERVAGAGDTSLGKLVDALGVEFTEACGALQAARAEIARSDRERR